VVDHAHTETTHTKTPQTQTAAADEQRRELEERARGRAGRRGDATFDANSKEHWLYLADKSKTNKERINAMDQAERWKELTKVYNLRLQDHLVPLVPMGVPPEEILKEAPYPNGVGQRWVSNMRKSINGNGDVDDGGETETGMQDDDIPPGGPPATTIATPVKDRDYKRAGGSSHNGKTKVFKKDTA
jgi:hypothetical protein